MHCVVIQVRSERVREERERLVNSYEYKASYVPTVFDNYRYVIYILQLRYSFDNSSIV